ncbi:hypothetical protein PI125_g4167 [Phytophthora idaei]|nr:hypothetical protein PI125_g4167 [Phytophthora idaei]
MFRNGVFGPMRYCMPSDVWDRFSFSALCEIVKTRAAFVSLPPLTKTAHSSIKAKPAVTTEAALVETEDSPFEQQGTEH